MTDITREPYAEWLKAALRDMVPLKPKSIALIAVTPDGSTATAYFNADSALRCTMVQSMVENLLVDWIRVNADLIGEILRGEEDEEAGP